MNPKLIPTKLTYNDPALGCPCNENVCQPYIDGKREKKLKSNPNKWNKSVEKQILH